MRSLRSTLALSALLWIVSSPALQADEGRSIGFGIGIVKPEHVDSTWSITGSIRFPLHEVLAVEPEVGYWKKSESLLGVEESLKDLNFGASLLYLIPLDRLTISLGGGAGAHHFTIASDVFDIEVSDSTTEFGLHVLGGLEYQASDSIAIFGQGRHDWVNDVLDQVKVYGGLRFRI